MWYSGKMDKRGLLPWLTANCYLPIALEVNFSSVPAGPEARSNLAQHECNRELRRSVTHGSGTPTGAEDSSPARSRGERQRAEGQVPGKGSIHELHTAVGRSAAKGGATQKRMARVAGI